MKSTQLSQLRQKIIGLALILPGLCLGLTGCEEPQVQPSHFYMVISPINLAQVQQARAFLNQAKGDGQPNAKIIVPGHRYTVAMFCEGNTPNFVNPGVDLQDKKNISAITQSADAALAEISGGRKNCTATAESLVNLAPHLNNAASSRNEKMILLIQVPWGDSELKKDFTKIKEGMDKLAASGKVEKIILFGVDGNASSRAATAFESFNKKAGTEVTMSPATDSPQLLEKLQKIHSDILKIK